MAVAVLAVGALSVNPGEYAARLQTGMTPAEVEAALGTAGRPDYATESLLHAPRDLSDLWSPATVERERALRKGESWMYRDYDVGSCAVAVAFRGTEGDERVTSVNAYRSARAGTSRRGSPAGRRRAAGGRVAAVAAGRRACDRANIGRRGSVIGDVELLIGRSSGLLAWLMAASDHAPHPNNLRVGNGASLWSAR